MFSAKQEKQNKDDKVIRDFGQEWQKYHYGDIDIPKGKVDEGETALEAARRELFEEAGISNVSFPYGELPIVINNISVYVSLTNEQPNIMPNPHSGIIEHADATWNSFSQMKTHSIEFLKPFILVAESVVTSKN